MASYASTQGPTGTPVAATLIVCAWGAGPTWHDVDKLVWLSKRRWFLRSISSPKWLKRSAPMMATSTLAMVKAHSNGRRKPRFSVRECWPYVAIVVPLAACSSRVFLCSGLRTTVRGKIERTEPESMRKRILCVRVRDVEAALNGDADRGRRVKVGTIAARSSAISCAPTEFEFEEAAPPGDAGLERGRPTSVAITEGPTACNSSATAASSSMVWFLMIVSNRRVESGSRSSQRTRKMSFDARAPASVRICSRSCDGFLSPSSMVPSSLWSWVSGESVRRATMASFNVVYLSCAGGARMMSETSEIVSGSSTVRIMLNLVESLVTWCMLNCASTWRNPQVRVRAPESRKSTISDGVHGWCASHRLEERVSDKLLEWVVLTWLGSVCSWNMLAVASATTLTVSSWRVLPWWVWIWPDSRSDSAGPGDGALRNLGTFSGEKTVTPNVFLLGAKNWSEHKLFMKKKVLAPPSGGVVETMIQLTYTYCAINARNNIIKLLMQVYDLEGRKKPLSEKMALSYNSFGSSFLEYDTFGAHSGGKKYDAGRALWWLSIHMPELALVPLHFSNGLAECHKSHGNARENPLRGRRYTLPIHQRVPNSIRTLPMSTSCAHTGICLSEQQLQLNNFLRSSCLLILAFFYEIILILFIV
ncbi:unnamed protein product [Trichogramma brassicae]|uniref:Uncharacterized protein n=1 Tax=Trichogramma brassicae TaxID=86971 RepID=A0A6H5IZT4_9HYME|nr:unnamed protein product [Trichogramma brassicae]